MRILTLFLFLLFSFSLIAQPTNDDCSAADAVGTLPWTSSAFDVTNATTTGDPSNTCQANRARSIWFTFTPSVSGNFYISTCQSDASLSTLPDVVLGVYTAVDCSGPFTQVACDDDACTTLSLQSVINSANLTAGTTYYIVAWQYCLNSCSAPSSGANSIQLFVKQNLPPDCATLNTPVNGSTNIALNTPLTWIAPSTGGTPTGYKVYLGTSNPPTTLVTTATSTSYTPSGQTASTTYYWYIVPTNGAGDATGCDNTVYSYTTADPPSCPGSLGSGVVNISSLPYTGTGLTNCGSGNNVTSSNATVCGSSNYYGGEDRTFIFTPTNTATYEIKITTTSTYTGLMLYAGCPFNGQGGTCVANSQSSTGNKTLNVSLTSGTTYYLIVDSYPSPACHPSFDLSITELVAPSCTSNIAPANGATGVSTTPTLSWASAPLATSYDLYFVGTVPSGSWTNPTNVAGTSYTILSGNILANNTTYTWYVVPKNSVGPATGCTANQTTFTTVSGPTTFSGTGNWSDPARWSAGIPTCTIPVTIASGANCTVDILTAVSGSITLTGTLNITSASNLTVGCGTTGGNRSVTVTGTLNISGGTMLVNGNVAINTSSTFSQSGGDLIIDGNDGTSGNSVASGTAMLQINSAGGTTTGGTITIVDPNFNSTGKAVDYSVTTTAKTWANHTLNIGDGISNQSSSNTAGFILESYTGTGRLLYGNLNIKGGSTTNRWASLGAWSINVGGKMTVDAGSEIRINSSSTSAVFTKDIENNGTITATVGISLAGISSNSVVGNSNTQTISGSGTWRNATTSPTANMVNLTVNNTSGTPITIPQSMITGTGTGSISGTLTLTAGKLDIGSNPLTLGVSTGTLGSLSPTTPTSASYIIGEFRRWRSTATGNYYFPVGTSSTPRFAQINFTTGQTTGGVIGVKFISGTPGTGGLPLASNAENGSIAIEVVSPTGYWNVERLTGGGGTYTATFDASGFTKADGTSAITDLANVKCIKRTSGGSWALGATGTSSTVSALSSIVRTGNTTFSDFALGGTAAALPVILTRFTGKSEKATNVLDWATTSEINTDKFTIERSRDGKNWEYLTELKASGFSTLEKVYSATDQKPFSLSFYRLKMIDIDGKYEYSNIVKIDRAGLRSDLVSVFPVPTTGIVTVQVEMDQSSYTDISVTDVTGKLLMSSRHEITNGVNEIPVDLSAFASGTYFIKIDTGTNQYTKRIMKE